MTSHETQHPGSTFSVPKLLVCLAVAFGAIALLHDYDPPVVPDMVVAPAIAVFSLWVAYVWSRPARTRTGSRS